MFFTVDEKKQINERTKHIPQTYVKEITQTIEDVINRKPVFIEKKYYEPITKEDYD